MATNQDDRSYENTSTKFSVDEDKEHDSMLQYHLPEMKSYLNMEELSIYLLAEHVIDHDDIVKLTVTGQLSKSQVIINLHNIIKSKKMATQFLSALKRSAAKQPAHEELLEIITASKQQTLSQSSESAQNAPTISAEFQSCHSNSSRPKLSLVNSDSDVQLIESENKCFATDKEITVDVESICKAESENGHESQMGHQAKTQVATSTQTTCQAKTNSSSNKDSKELGCGKGYTFGLLTVFGFFLLAAGITIIIYGVAGHQGQDRCAELFQMSFVNADYYLVEFGRFDITLGLTTILLAFAILFSLLTIYCDNQNLCEVYLRRVIISIDAFLILFFCLAALATFFFSWHLSTEVYRSYPLLKASASHCTSPVYYITFVYITLQYSAIGLVILLCVILFVVGILVFKLCPS